MSSTNFGSVLSLQAALLGSDNLVGTYLCKLRCWGVIILLVLVISYSGSIPRVADAARYVRARKISTNKRGQKEEAHDLVRLAI